VDIRESYDSAARAYAEHLFNELQHKPLDRHLLNRFAEAVKGQGTVLDLGCGPGHVAKYLHDQGLDVFGIDLSPKMIECATELCAGVNFFVGDMRQLECADGQFAGIAAFYSIVHFGASELGGVFEECRRILADDGLMLIAFHAGDEVVHVEDLWEQPVSLDFRFHDPSQVSELLHQAGFVVAETSEREPYDEVEYPSRRCYLLCRATKGELRSI
jgi:SAM-dependent methyltransferase